MYRILFLTLDNRWYISYNPSLNSKVAIKKKKKLCMYNSYSLIILTLRNKTQEHNYKDDTSYDYTRARKCFISIGPE